MSKISKTLKNAVLLKEIQIKSKRAGVSVVILVINILLALSAAITMIAVNYCIVSNGSDVASSFTVYFMVIVILESVVLFFVTPALSAGAIASERERQTLDVLLTTNMSPWQIIWGKYWSSIANVMVLILSTLPFLSIVFLFGGVSFFTVLGILGALVCTVMYLGSFGILMSTLIKKTNAASVVCYIVLLAITFGSMSLTATIVSVASILNELIWTNDPTKYGVIVFNSDWSLVLLLFSPATVAFDLFSKAFGISFFWSNINSGMGYFINLITSDRLSETCFLGKYWSLIAISVQLFTGFWVLKLAAVCLNPVKRKKNKKQKAEKNRK